MGQDDRRGKDRSFGRSRLTTDASVYRLWHLAEAERQLSSHQHNGRTLTYCPLSLLIDMFTILKAVMEPVTVRGCTLQGVDRGRRCNGR
jgi:hypothetical protein